VFRSDRNINTPKAPGLGLMLKRCLFDDYNKKSSQNVPLTFEDVKDKMEAFENDVIIPYIIKTEKEERVFKEWLETTHEFDAEAILHCDDTPKQIKGIPPDSTPSAIDPLALKDTPTLANFGVLNEQENISNILLTTVTQDSPNDPV